MPLGDAAAEAAPGDDSADRLWYFAKRVGFFVVAGPPIGAILTFLIPAAIMDPPGNLSRTLTVMLESLPFVVVFSYFFGGLSAFITGIVFLIVESFLSRRLFICAATVTTGILSSVVAAYVITGRSWQNIALFAVAGAVSATICSGIFCLCPRLARVG